MADLTVQKTNKGGLTPVFTSADSLGDSFSNSGDAVLYVKNGDTTDKTVTIDSQRPCDQGFDHDLTVTVSAGSEEMIGPFNSYRFNDDSNKVNVSYDAVTSVTVAVIKLGG